MQAAEKGRAPWAQADALRIGIVRARFNAPVTERLLTTCLSELRDLGVPDSNIRCLEVPGALEVPVALDALARSRRHDALIALGCIIRGETYHFELVANESGTGVMRVSLDHHIPIANAILTVENLAQAVARVEEKGRDAARVAVEMAHLLDSTS